MFTIINNNEYKKYVLWIRFMLRSDITQITAHYWNVARGHKKDFFAA